MRPHLQQGSLCHKVTYKEMYTVRITSYVACLLLISQCQATEEVSNDAAPRGGADGGVALFRACVKKHCDKKLTVAGRIACSKKICQPAKKWLDTAHFKRWVDNSHFTDKKWLDNSHFNDKRWLDNAHFEDKKWLDNAHFEDKKWLDNAHFEDKKWLDSVQYEEKRVPSISKVKRWLDNAQFEDKRSQHDKKLDSSASNNPLTSMVFKKWLDNAHFNDKKWIDNTQFVDKKWLDSNHFDDKKWVDNSHFTDKKWLDNAHFNDKKWLDTAHFNDKKWLDNAHFDDKKWLDNAQFTEDKKWLDNAHFNDKKWLDNAHFNDKRWIDAVQYAEKKNVHSLINCVTTTCEIIVQDDGQSKVSKECLKKCFRNVPVPTAEVKTSGNKASPTRSSGVYPTKRWVDPLNYGLDKKRSAYVRFSNCFRQHCAHLQRENYHDCVRDTCMPIVLSETEP